MANCAIAAVVLILILALQWLVIARSNPEGKTEFFSDLPDVDPAHWQDIAGASWWGHYEGAYPLHLGGSKTALFTHTTSRRPQISKAKKAGLDTKFTNRHNIRHGRRCFGLHRRRANCCLVTTFIFVPAAIDCADGRLRNALGKSRKGKNI